MKKEFLFIVAITALFSSCNKNKNLQLSIEALTGQQVVLPDSVSAVDTQNKLVIWFDSLECASCRSSRLFIWDDDPAVQYAKGLKDKFGVILIFSPKKEDVNLLIITLKKFNLSFPVIIDEAGDFSRLNPHIPADKRLHAFLLDKDNRVVLVGNPLGNAPLWELYKEQIRTLVNEP
jgi:hypothetical protein